MQPQILLSSLMALAAGVSAGPIAARGGPDATCFARQTTGAFFAIQPKNYLYGIYCGQKYEGASVKTFRAFNLLACAIECDKVSNAGGFICHAANFKPGTSTGDNCELHYKSVHDDITDIIGYPNPDWEAVQVTKTKVPNVV